MVINPVISSLVVIIPAASPFLCGSAPNKPGSNVFNFRKSHNILHFKMRVSRRDFSIPTGVKYLWHRQ
ncbi:Uncharacterised protein [Salmonella enterica subsp. enterica serovar Typhi]|nr:Uncharacterised protein [Salmonella enterica subsp. enterica serovar Typhi]CPR71593.1 Uncharacterised protein [Salmonella enterica subsp. enterica serovar Bovismorbificans]CQY27195.1 Uncharacterised protein [Salmonella enterica subsp. enterica serovar Typhi]CRA46770.1 Uncharacterised protein [Salmonella enterica subsp. enterica serovar Typhi]